MLCVHAAQDHLAVACCCVQATRRVHAPNKPLFRLVPRGIMGDQDPRRDVPQGRKR
jgi:hypothetical protein